MAAVSAAVVAAVADCGLIALLSVIVAARAMQVLRNFIESLSYQPVAIWKRVINHFFKSLKISVNGVNGMSDIEGKTAREAVSECGQRANFNWARAAWLVTP